MRPTPRKPDDFELDLPALDGEGEGEEPTTDDVGLVFDEPEGDAFDDATGEGEPHDDFVVDGAEAGWLDDSESLSALDVGPFDVAIQAEGKVLEDDEPDGSKAGLEDLLPNATEGAFVADAGEEGPLADDDALREEDLPALDADDDGDVPDEQLFDPGALAGEEDLRWDDRAWKRVTPAPGAGPDEGDDSGMLAIPGDDAAHAARDEAWRRLEESGRAMAAAFVPGGSVVVALSTPDRARAQLVRIQPDGEARIIAEIDPRAASDDDDGCLVTILRWDAARGCLFVGGSFGVEAYRPG